MDASTIGWLSIALLFILLSLRVPVAFVLYSVGLLGAILILGTGPGLKLVALVPYSSIAKYSFTVVPLFILMGHLFENAGFTKELFDTARKWLGNFTGGLLHATVAAAAVFGAACGSGIASCATITKVAVPGMLEQGVDRKLAFGTVGSVGTIAQMIPPSILMVIYGIITGTPIAKLLVAGVFPGIITAISYMVLISIKVKRNPDLCPPMETKVSLKEKVISINKIWSVAVIIVVIIGGIYTGKFTPTEAGGMGAFAALLLGLVTKRVGLHKIKDSLYETSKTTGMVYLIVSGAFVFGYLLSMSRIPHDISTYLGSLDVNRYYILGMILFMYIILGCFMDVLPTLIITLPIVFPAMMGLGFDPIWFGILVIKITELGMITPPFGLNLFVIKGIIPDASFKEIVLGILPFIVVEIVVLVILVSFPQISLFLPMRMN